MYLHLEETELSEILFLCWLHLQLPFTVLTPRIRRLRVSFTIQQMTKCNVGYTELSAPEVCTQAFRVLIALFVSTIYLFTTVWLM